MMDHMYSIQGRVSKSVPAAHDGTQSMLYVCIDTRWLVDKSLRVAFDGAAMRMEQQHVGSVAEEAALRPDRLPS